MSVAPSENFEVDYEIDFGGGLVQRAGFILSEGIYDREISRAKTFCFESDIQKMRSMGLAKGGSLSNALVMGKEALLNPEQQTYDDEFVRHKILDFLGDMRLLDRPILGRFVVRRGGACLPYRLPSDTLGERKSSHLSRGRLSGLPPFLEGSKKPDSCEPRPALKPLLASGPVPAHGRWGHPVSVGVHEAASFSPVFFFLIASLHHPVPGSLFGWIHA